MSRNKKRFNSHREKPTEAPQRKAEPVTAPRNRMIWLALPLLILICGGLGLVLFRTSLRSLPRGYPDLPDMTPVNPILREFLQRKDANARSHSDSAEALGGLAMAYHANQFFESARRAYQLAGRLDPNDYRWFYCQALLEEDLAEAKTLVELWERTIRLQNYPPAYQKLAEHFFKRDELEKSADLYTRVLRLDPSLVSALVGRARISARQGNWPLVIQNLEPVAKRRPRIRAVHQLLADAYQAVGRSDQAAESRKILGQSDLLPTPRVSDPLRDQLDDLCYLSTPLLKLAYAAESMGQHEKMLQLSRRAVAADPGDADAHHFLARALILEFASTGERRLAEATTHGLEAVRLKPEYAEAFNNLGNLQFQQRNWRGAQRYYLRALAKTRLR